ncbi:RcnB family protein [Poseidonocella sp. HB161398]|uniref:RcnB family protein n=1 Tax=Poseidonocella sp. HB161398 TaxID=2320855 RepID=UPI001108E8BC|nr:RcnB family protein [Poseidonocella sp. HB161398]
MKTDHAAMLFLALSLALPAAADSKKPDKVQTLPPGASAGTPPGLAKKPAGLPPGQLKKIYRRGEVLPGGLVWITDYGKWRLPPLAPGEGYARYDGEVYRVARDTAVVLEAIGIVTDLMR